MGAGGRGGRIGARGAGVVAILAGAVVIAAVVASSMPSRADAGERATDLVRRELGDDGLARHRADFEVATAGLDELYDEVLPGLAAALGWTPARFEDEVRARYPAVGRLLGDDDRRAGRRFAEGIVANLERHQRNFEEADAIPLRSLPMTAGPVAAVALGVLLVAAGAWALLRPGAAPLAVVVVLGLVPVLGTFATRYPQKADAAADLLSTLNVTPAIAAETRALFAAAEAAVDEAAGRLLPDVASSLGSTGARVGAVLGRSPDLAALLEDREGIFRRYDERVAIREGGLEVIPEAKRFPLEAATWWAVVPGAVVALVGGAALLALRRAAPPAPPAAGGG